VILDLKERNLRSKGLGKSFVGIICIIGVNRVNGQTSIYISAKEKINIDILREELYTRVKEIHITRYPYTDFLYASP